MTVRGAGTADARAPSAPPHPHPLLFSLTPPSSFPPYSWSGPSVSLSHSCLSLSPGSSFSVLVSLLSLFFLYLSPLLPSSPLLLFPFPGPHSSYTFANFHPEARGGRCSRASPSVGLSIPSWAPMSSQEGVSKRWRQSPHRGAQREAAEPHTHRLKRAHMSFCLLPKGTQSFCLSLPHATLGN